PRISSTGRFNGRSHEYTAFRSSSYAALLTCSGFARNSSEVQLVCGHALISKPFPLPRYFTVNDQLVSRISHDCGPSFRTEALSVVGYPLLAKLAGKVAGIFSRLRSPMMLLAFVSPMLNFRAATAASIISLVRST